MVKISALPSDSAPTLTDYIIVNDIETGATKKVLLSDLAPILFGSWGAWTPSYTNLTVGNGTVKAKFIKIGKTVHFRWSLVFGSTTSFTGTQASITLPSTINSDYQTGAEWANIGIVKPLDAGTADYIGYVTVLSSTTFGLNLIGAGGTYGARANVINSQPFTWGTGDSIIAIGTYEEA